MTDVGMCTQQTLCARHAYPRWSNYLRRGMAQTTYNDRTPPDPGPAELQQVATGRAAMYAMHQMFNGHSKTPSPMFLKSQHIHIAPSRAERQGHFLGHVHSMQHNSRRLTGWTTLAKHTQHAAHKEHTA